MYTLRGGMRSWTNYFFVLHIFLPKAKDVNAKQRWSQVYNKIWTHRPSVKGTKPLFIVIKPIIIILINLIRGSPVRAGTSGELIPGRLYVSESVHSIYIFFPSPPHTPFWSWCKRHCWFPNTLVSVPEALMTTNLWRSHLGEPLPPSTIATWKSFRWGHRLFQSLRTQRVPRFAVLPVVFLFSRKEGESFHRLEVELDGSPWGGDVKPAELWVFVVQIGRFQVVQQFICFENR